MSITLIVAALLWLVVMREHGSFGAVLPIAYRIQASILTLYLVMAGAMDLNIVWWGLFHPHAFLIHYLQSSSFFPPQVTVAIVVFSLLSGIFGLSIGFKISQRKSAGFNWAVRYAPFLLGAALLDGSRIISAHIPDWDPPKLGFVSAFFIASNIAIYVWLYRFAKDPKNRQFIDENSLRVRQPTG